MNLTRFFRKVIQRSVAMNEMNGMNEINERKEMNEKGVKMGPLGTFAHLPTGGAGAFGA